LPLNGKQRRALRALGHHLDPVVQLGKEGVTPALLEAVEQALDDHELIKLKVGESSPIDRHEAADEISRETGAEIAQVLGRTILLFRRHPEEPKIELPGLPLPPRPARTEPAGKGAPARGGRTGAKPSPRTRGPRGKHD
jgi:RNA-binding protein